MEHKLAFSVENVSFSYGENLILDHISFGIKKGKITTFLGANGSGKSTLLSLLTKNNQADHGNIFLYDQNIAQIPLKQFAQKVAIVHQNNSAPSDLTVEEVVRFGRMPYQSQFSANVEQDEKAVARALKITQLYSLKDRPIGQMSGGQRQRVFIAMAIAQETEILCLVEPTTYLDVKHQLYILKLVQMLHETYGTTVIMVLHDINQALAYSDEIVALSPTGRKLVQGPPQKVITADLIEKIYDIPLPIINVGGRPFVLAV